MSLPARRVVDLNNVDNRIIYRTAIDDGLINLDTLVKQQRDELERQGLMEGIVFAAQVYRALYPGPLTPPILDWMKDRGVPV